MVCGLFAVRSGLFDFWEKGRPVTVPVKALGGQKTGPDRTFKHYAYTLSVPSVLGSLAGLPRHHLAVYMLSILLLY